jgi:hypothetical protein
MAVRIDSYRWEKTMEAISAIFAEWEAPVWVASYFGLWAADIIWNVVAGFLECKGKFKEKTRESGLAVLAFLAGMAAIGFMVNALALPAIAVVILWAVSMFVVAFTSMLVGNKMSR